MQKTQFMAFRLDDNVVITLLAVAIIASMAFVVRYKSYKPCSDFDITSVGSRLTAGSTIRFETNAKDFKRLEWNFGDNQQSVTEVGSVIHSFDSPGDYTIAVTLDGGRCVEFRTVRVEAAPEVVDATLIAKAVIPESVEVGVPFMVKDTSNRSQTWAWRFGETADVDGNTRETSYAYKTEGWKTISVVINGNEKTPLVRKIFVNPRRETATPAIAAIPGPRTSRGGGLSGHPNTAPLNEQLNPTPQQQAAPTPAPAPEKKYPNIVVADFNQMLMSSAGGRRGAGEFAKYFCDENLNTTVILNGKATTFQQFFAKVAGVKKEDKLRLTTTLHKNGQSNCIQKIDVIGKVKAGVLGMSWRDL